jgi:hypothetical protein
MHLSRKLSHTGHIISKKIRKTEKKVNKLNKQRAKMSTVEYTREFSVLDTELLLHRDNFDQHKREAEEKGEKHLPNTFKEDFIYMFNKAKDKIKQKLSRKKNKDVEEEKEQ